MTRYRSYRTALVVRPCAGVLCERHERCARYAMVDGTSWPSAHWLAHCFDGESWPAFIDMGFIGPPRPEHFSTTRRTLQLVRQAA